MLADGPTVAHNEKINKKKTEKLLCSHDHSKENESTTCGISSLINFSLTSVCFCFVLVTFTEVMNLKVHNRVVVFFNETLCFDL